MFLNDWANSTQWHSGGIEGLKNDFIITDKDLEGVTILVASYTYEDYNGDAYVLFERGGRLFEVIGSHCSCYGLEGQWDPDEVTVDDLRASLAKGKTWGERYRIREHIEAVIKAKTP